MLRSAPLVIAVFVLSAFAQSAPLALAAEGPLYTVDGHVRDDQGAPIAGAYVYGWTMPPEGGEQSYDEATTGEDGSFSLQLAAGKGYVSVSHEKYRASDSRDLLVDGNVTDIALVLPTPPPRTAIVQGIVVGEGGAPIEGATVTISQGCCYAYDTPASPPGTETPAPSTDVTPGSTGNATPVGDDEASGVGSSGSAPTTTMRRPYWYDHDHQAFTTGPDGKYRFETYAGPRTLTASARGYAQTTVDVEARADDTVTRDIRLVKVPKADAVLDVRVVDSRTGLPLQGAHVSLQNLEWSRSGWGTTGADGRTSITTLPGWTTLNVYYYGYAPPVLLEGDVASSEPMSTIAPSPIPKEQYYTYVKTLRLASGEQDLDVKLEAKPEPTVVLTGYVVDPDAEAGVAGAQVSVWNQDTGDWGSATTDATGSYRILVRPGHYTVNAWAPGHLPGAGMFVIGPDEKAKRVDIDAPAGEQRYAPCESDDSCGCCYPAYAEKGHDGIAVGRVTTSGAPSPAPSMGAPSTLLEQDASQAAGDDTRAATYQGTGGGLPPYDKESAPADTSSVSGAAEVPGFGLALALAAAAVALAALGAASRRR